MNNDYPSGPRAYDKRGIPILPGDTVKMFHYTSRLRREKRYMYKYVVSLVDPLYTMSHLNLKNETWFMLADDKRHWNLEILQGYAGVSSGQDYRDRPRKKYE